MRRLPTFRTVTFRKTYHKAPLFRPTFPSKKRRPTKSTCFTTLFKDLNFRQRVTFFPIKQRTKRSKVRYMPRCKVLMFKHKHFHSRRQRRGQVQTKRRLCRPTSQELCTNRVPLVSKGSAIFYRIFPKDFFLFREVHILEVNSTQYKILFQGKGSV